jgi:hypothetical protein
MLRRRFHPAGGAWKIEQPREWKAGHALRGLFAVDKRRSKMMTCRMAGLVIKSHRKSSKVINEADRLTTRVRKS